MENEKIGVFIRYKRIEAKYSTRQLGEKIGISKSLLNQIENGAIGHHEDYVEMIFRFFDLSYENFEKNYDIAFDLFFEKIIQEIIYLQADYQDIMILLSPYLSNQNSIMLPYAKLLELCVDCMIEPGKKDIPSRYKVIKRLTNHFTDFQNYTLELFYTYYLLAHQRYTQAYTSLENAHYTLYPDYLEALYYYLLLAYKLRQSNFSDFVHSYHMANRYISLSKNSKLGVAIEILYSSFVRQLGLYHDSLAIDTFLIKNIDDYDIQHWFHDAILENMALNYISAKDYQKALDANLRIFDYIHNIRITFSIAFCYHMLEDDDKALEIIAKGKKIDEGHKAFFALLQWLEEDILHPYSDKALKKLLDCHKYAKDEDHQYQKMILQLLALHYETIGDYKKATKYLKLFIKNSQF